MTSRDHSLIWIIFNLKAATVRVKITEWMMMLKAIKRTRIATSIIARPSKLSVNKLKRKEWGLLNFINSNHNIRILKIQLLHQAIVTLSLAPAPPLDRVLILVKKLQETRSMRPRLLKIRTIWPLHPYNLTYQAVIILNFILLETKQGHQSPYSV